MKSISEANPAYEHYAYEYTAVLSTEGEIWNISSLHTCSSYITRYMSFVIVFCKFCYIYNSMKIVNTSGRRKTVNVKFLR